MVLHGFTGCNTTSTVYDKEKTSFLKRIVASDEIRDAMEVISNPWPRPFEVGDAEQKLFLNIYGGTGNDNLITKRFVFWSNCKFGKTNPQVHLIMIVESHKNTTYPNLSKHTLTSSLFHAPYN